MFTWISFHSKSSEAFGMNPQLEWQFLEPHPCGSEFVLKLHPFKNLCRFQHNFEFLSPQVSRKSSECIIFSFGFLRFGSKEPTHNTMYPTLVLCMCTLYRSQVGTKCKLMSSMTFPDNAGQGTTRSVSELREKKYSELARLCELEKKQTDSQKVLTDVPLLFFVVTIHIVDS